MLNALETFYSTTHAKLNLLASSTSWTGQQFNFHSRKFIKDLKNMMMYQALYLLLGLILAVEQSSSTHVSSLKLYSRDGYVLDPTKVYHHLNNLSEHYRLRIDEYSRQKYFDIINMIDASRVDAERCEYYQDDLRNLVKMLEANKDYPNIVHYLRHHALQQFSLCRVTLTERLKETVDHSSFDESRLKALKQSVMEVDPGRRSDPLYRIQDDKLLSRAIVAFLERVSDGLAKKVVKGKTSGKTIYTTEFEKHVKTPCRLVQSILEQPTAEFRLLSSDETLLAQLGPFVREWLQNYNICDSIVGGGASKTQELLNDSYSFLFFKTPKPKSSLSKLTSCLTCGSGDVKQ